MRYGSAFQPRFSSALNGPAAEGVVFGLFSWTWTSQFIMAWGTGLEAGVSLAIAALVAGSTLLLRPDRARRPAWVLLALAAWAVAVPTLITRTTGPLASIVDDPARAVFAALASALLVLTPGLALIVRALPARRAMGRDHLRITLATMGLTWCLAPLTVGPWPGPQTAALCAAGFLLVKFARNQLASQPAPLPVVEQQTAAPVNESWMTIVVPALMAGAIVPAMFWLQQQLFLMTAALWCAAWGGLLLGIAAAARRSTVATEAAAARAGRHCALLAMLVAGCAIGLTELIRLAMTISGSVSWLPAILGLRTAIVAALMFLPGVALGAAANTTSSGRSIVASARPLIALACFLASWGLARGLNVTLLSALPLALVASAAAMGLWLASLRTASTTHRLRWTAPAGAACALALAAAASPEQALSGQRILFSGAHFQARTFGVPTELLPALDDGRLIRRHVGSAGVTAVWSHAGTQWVLRENGLTRGVVSTQPDLCPQSVPEVLSAVLPLTLHAQPHHILVTSASYPTVAATCLLFPVETVTALDDNPEALKFCREAAERVCPSLLHGDNRLTLHQAEAVRGLATMEGLYDIVIAPGSVVGDLDSCREWTVEHFRNIAAHLAADGVYCQRVTCFDLGVASILDLVHTAQAVFPNVQISEVAPGEWLLVGRMTDDASLDASYLERLEKTHVRDVLAQAGWDWSIMLSLKTIHPSELATLTKNAAVLSGLDAQVAYALPLEVMSWGAKFDLRRRWIGQHARPLGDALGEEPALADVAQRLSDVTLAQQIMIDHPDQFAAYRHYVKKRLQDRPRPKVIQVAGEGLKNGLHPEDSRRKAYLAALGKAVETKSRPEINRLGDFFSPFDPLVTPFLPREFVHLDRQCATPDHAAEWRVGFRSIYFSPPNDASVNNVCDALEVLHNHPDVAGDPLARWDAANALLEVLKNRWGWRMNSGATLRYGVADAHRTLELAAATLDHMDQWRSEAGVSEENWQLRRTVVEKHLIRPVRSWRSEQSAQLALQGGSETRPPAASAANVDDSL